MAGITGQPRGVVRRHNLRKALGLGRAGRMAAGAEHGRIRQLRLHRGWVLGMAEERGVWRGRWHDQGDETLVKVRLGLHWIGQTLDQRPVAGFAVHMRMLAVLLLVRHIRVAGFARVVPRKLRRVSGNLAHRGSAIVPILSKGLGDYVVAYHQKHQKGEDEKPRKPEKMPCILEDTHQALSITPLPGGSANLFQCDLEHSSY